MPRSARTLQWEVWATSLTRAGDLNPLGQDRLLVKVFIDRAILLGQEGFDERHDPKEP